MADQNICFKCATDLFLGGVIRRKGISTCCSLCAVKRKCFPIDQIVSRVEAILHDYICVPDLHRTVMKDGSVETTLGKRIEFWASHIFRTTEEAPIVAAVCANLKAFSNDRVTLERSFRVITSARNGESFRRGFVTKAASSTRTRNSFWTGFSKAYTATRWDLMSVLWYGFSHQTTRLQFSARAPV
ncbi:TPA: hypothetical protein QEM76_006083 [Pseudomonas putida]|jgi:hypothetical protein|uniref:hypothetical protein n=1 Tax=Pseudomonas sp. 22515 TaxID=3453934 RepID=UPI0032FEEFCE|nr:hypothetical protein [Pseudomonas putida]HDS1809272.1 hypothetical protein [Pseudomonas putida]